MFLEEFAVSNLYYYEYESIPFRWMKHCSAGPKSSHTFANPVCAGAQSLLKSPVHWWHVRRSAGKRCVKETQINLWNVQKLNYFLITTLLHPVPIAPTAGHGSHSALVTQVALVAAERQPRIVLPWAMVQKHMKLSSSEPYHHHITYR